MRKCVRLGMSRFPEPLPRPGKPRKADAGTFPTPPPSVVASPSDACSGRDPDSRAEACASRARCSLLFPASSSLHHVLLSHSVQEMLQRLLPKSVCPPSRWHTPNCQLTGGHTTWGTANFPTRWRPAAGCRSRCSADGLWPPVCSPSPRRAIPPARAREGSASAVRRWFPS